MDRLRFALESGLSGSITVSKEFIMSNFERSLNLNSSLIVPAWSVGLLFIVLASSTANAEYFGSLNGRTAKFNAHPTMTVEATFSTGDFLTSDYQQISLRFNYQYSPRVLMFGDLGQSELSGRSDTSIGVGGYYALNTPVLWSDHSAVKMSLHQVDFGILPGSTYLNCSAGLPYIGIDGLLYIDPGICTTVVGPSRGGDVRNIAAELLISGAIDNPIIGDAASWYANGGIQMLSGDIADDTVVSLGGGIVYPFSATEFYAGWEYADELFVGIGVRYLIK